jgi:hypothetical protein
MTISGLTILSLGLLCSYVQYVTEKSASTVAKSEKLFFLIARVIWYQFFADFVAQNSSDIFLLQYKK